MKNLIFTGLSAVILAGSIAPYADAIENTRSAASIPVQVAINTEADVREGQFETVDQSHPTTGMARIVTENGQRYLELDSNFDTARGPAVQVVLYTGEAVPVNLAEGDYTVVGNLQSFEGAQRYALPTGVNPDDYGSVAIWCAEFNVTFGFAAL